MSRFDTGFRVYKMLLNSRGNHVLSCNSEATELLGKIKWISCSFLFLARQHAQHFQDLQTNLSFFFALCQTSCVYIFSLTAEQAKRHIFNTLLFVFVFLRTGPGVLATAEGEHGPRGSPTVPTRRGTSDPPAAGGGQRPDAVPSLLRIRTVPAVPGRHWSASLTTKRTLFRQVNTWPGFCT